MNRLNSIVIATALTLAACGDERRPTGDNCGEDGPCADGLCVQDRCIDPEGDEDTDGVINRIEADLGSDAFNADTDGDGISDPDELGPGFAAIDTDGDGIADILESAISDDDDDCIPNQYDAENATPNGDLSPLVPVLCPDEGVCGAEGAVLAVVCSDGFASATCDFRGVSDYAATEGTACDDLDNNCNGAVDEGLDCTPEPPPLAGFHVLVPGWSVEQNTSGAILIPRSEYLADMAITEDRLLVGGGCLSDAFIRIPVPGIAAIRTFLRCSTETEEVEFKVASGAISIAIPADEGTNDFGNTERSEGFTLLLQPLTTVSHPRLADVLFGQTIRRYTINPDTRTPTIGREISGYTFIRKADDMTSADLVGDWGFVRLGVVGSGTELAATYSGGIYPGAFVARDGVVAFDGGGGIENSGIQDFDSSEGNALAMSRRDSRGEPGIPVEVSTAGRITLGEQDRIFGAVSPAADFAVLLDAPHDLDPAVMPTEWVIDNDADEAAYHYVVGVRRDATPLATISGHSYRVMHHGFSPAFAGFGVFFAVQETAIRFDSNGTTATYDPGETYFSAPFAGVIDEAISAARPVELTVAPAELGRINLTASATGDNVGSGYVQAGGRMLVLITHDATSDGLGAVVNAQYGLMIAVCTDCD